MSKIEITPELLAELKDKAEKATPGPWCLNALEILYINSSEDDPTKIVAAVGEWDDEGRQDVIFENAIANAGYIASANPQVVLALLAHIRKLEKDLDGLCHDDTEKELRIERLEKEADWLASQVAMFTDHASISEWREAARKAVEEA